MKSKFRQSAWDPPLIISQIICLQSLYYGFLAFSTSVLMKLFDGSNSLDFLVGWQHVGVNSVNGMLIILGHLVAAFASSYAVVVVVERARLCLDFTGTLYLLHWLFVAYLSSSIPRSLTWYVLLFASFALTFYHSRSLCIERELQPIEIQGSHADRTHSKNRNASEPTTGDSQFVVSSPTGSSKMYVADPIPLLPTSYKGKEKS